MYILSGSSALDDIDADSRGLQHFMVLSRQRRPLMDSIFMQFIRQSIQTTKIQARIKLISNINWLTGPHEQVKHQQEGAFNIARKSKSSQRRFSGITKLNMADTSRQKAKPSSESDVPMVIDRIRRSRWRHGRGYHVMPRAMKTGVQFEHCIRTWRIKRHGP